MATPLTRLSNIQLTDVASLWGLVVAGRVVLHFSKTQSFVRTTNRLAKFNVLHRKADRALIARVETATYQASAWVPGSHCLHRAAAAKIFLALRGVQSKIVIGFRKQSRLEGHAWLEVDALDGWAVLFASDGDGFETRWIPG